LGSDPLGRRRKKAAAIDRCFREEERST